MLKLKYELSGAERDPMRFSEQENIYEAIFFKRLSWFKYDIAVSINYTAEHMGALFCDLCNDSNLVWVGFD